MTNVEATKPPAAPRLRGVKCSEIRENDMPKLTPKPDVSLNIKKIINPSGGTRAVRAEKQASHAVETMRAVLRP